MELGCRDVEGTDGADVLHDTSADFGTVAYCDEDLRSFAITFFDQIVKEKRKVLHTSVFEERVEGREGEEGKERKGRGGRASLKQLPVRPR